jgi:iron complex transport system substrate-binding protein
MNYRLLLQKDTPYKILISILIFGTVMIIGCRQRSGYIADRGGNRRTDVEKAERFRLERFGNYTKLTVINPWQGASNLNQTYLLLRRGAKIPSGTDSATVIIVPVKKIICMSTTHAAMISALREDRSIAGMSGTNYIYNNNLVRMAEKGLIRDVGYEANLNKELILRIAPDLIVMYGIGNESAGYVGKIKELGMNVLFDADYLESEPLGKAEWIKVFGALFCKEALADSIFNNEVQSYNSLKSYISQNISDRPKVLLGLPFKDTWFVSPGNTFISRLISDAGGEYLWKYSESSVSMPMGIENVYIHAIDADYWLNIGTVKSRNEISSVDQRLKDIPCFKKGNLFNNNNRININGGNDYWESGSVYPHLILKDIASILHPEFFRDNELFFYQKIY